MTTRPVFYPDELRAAAETAPTIFTRPSADLASPVIYQNSNVSMTERLYYTDSYLRDFTARITGHADDGRTVCLDRSAFYPTALFEELFHLKIVSFHPGPDSATIDIGESA
jgi:hypothetical protein